MATGDQIRALLRSYASGDHGRFDTIALQIAAQSARQGQQQLADEIRSLVEQARMRVSGSQPRPVSKAGAEQSGLVRVSYPKVRVSEMVLTCDVQSQVKDLILQQKQREQLHERGFEPKRRILLVGPPGCGKTMTASAIAAECHLPLLFVQLHMLMSRYLGETSGKLNQIFEAMAETRGVYFFDEFDAIGSTREGANDVGEMRRVLNTFLQLVEHDQSDSLLIAATNLDKILDVALYRRFDCVIRYGLPDRSAIRLLIENRLTGLMKPRALNAAVLDVATGLSHAEVVRASEDAARTAIINGNHLVAAADLAAAMKARKSMRFST